MNDLNVPTDAVAAAPAAPQMSVSGVAEASFFSRHKWLIIALLLIVIGISLYYAMDSKIIDMDVPSITSGKSSDEISLLVDEFINEFSAVNGEIAYVAFSMKDYEILALKIFAIY